ncbi:MAG: hypothetical protein DHS20C09_05530 [marine bacterium B5-7]|nr:MAG: hypothetical protein DHS20C09_05530 [marine bacterium B5-7]
MQLESQKLVIEEALAAAKAANNDKNRFLAAASHDLRQPLHAMTLFLGSLRRAVKGDLETELVGKVDETASILSEQFDSLLDLSKFDAGVIEPNLSCCRLDTLLEKVVSGARPTAQQKDLDLILDIDPITVRTDLLLLERLIRNLVVNAIQFTSCGSITLEAGIRNGVAQIRIVDTGQGIHEEDQQRIFQDYFQVHNKARTKSKGSGLGLAIVQRIASLLGIQLSIESSIGKGSTFSLELPGDAVKPSNSVAVESEAKNTRLIREGAMLGQGLNILIVDDEQVILDAVSGVLRDWGANPIVASSFEELKKLLISQGRIDAFILDDMLNEQTTGLLIAKYLRERDKTCRILITTGNTDKSRLRTIRDSGFEVLTKPVADQRLFDTINRLVS